jgi:methylmalonyl-CoA mutase cobalamin-binding subunit
MIATAPCRRTWTSIGLSILTWRAHDALPRVRDLLLEAGRDDVLVTGAASSRKRTWSAARKRIG